jgi:hypothetical protein
MAKNESILKGEWGGYIKIALAIVIVIIGYPLISNIVKKIKNSVNLDAAVSGAGAAAGSLNPPAGTTAARALKIKGWADTLHDLFTSGLNKASSVVAVLNDTLNAQDVAALSEYYQSSYNKSLLAEVNDELGSGMNWFGKGWADLKDHVKNTLY